MEEEAEQVFHAMAQDELAAEHLGLESPLSPFRQFLTLAPLKVIGAVLQRYYRQSQIPPPAPEFSLGYDQWTITFDDDEQVLRVICEENALVRADWDTKKNRAEAATGRAMNQNRTAKEELVNAEGELGDPGLARDLNAKIIETQRIIDESALVIKEADGFLTETVEMRFALGEIA